MQKPKHLLFVLPNGDTFGRYHDVMVYGGKRPEDIRRISNVEWDFENKQWSFKLSTMQFFSPTRKSALALEGQLVDMLIADLMECWQHAKGTFECPECHFEVRPIEIQTCPACGHAFRNHLQGLKLDDFPFVDMLKATRCQTVVP